MRRAVLKGGGALRSLLALALIVLGLGSLAFAGTEPAPPATTPMAPSMPMEKGTPLIVRAADVATIARMSGSFSRSCDSTVTTTWVSFLKPLTNKGRIGRSIRRETRVSFSDGRPSRLKKPPGILPAAKVFSW